MHNLINGYLTTRWHNFMFVHSCCTLDISTNLEYLNFNILVAYLSTL